MEAGRGPESGGEAVPLVRANARDCLIARTRRSVTDMNTPGGIGEFLTTRRARLTPEQARLPTYGGGHRRVPGLRREEVAMLAGMSPQYYIRLERGNATGVSESMLDGISRALQLDAAERAHLHNLVSAANSGGRRRTQRGPVQQVRPGVQQTLDAMAEVPAVVQNGRLDVLAANRLGTALWAELFEQPERPANFARYVFLDPRATTFYRDWDDAAQQTVALLRSEAGRVPARPGAHRSRRSAVDAQ